MGEAGPWIDSASAPGRGDDAESWRRFTRADALIFIACLALGWAVARALGQATWSLDSVRPSDDLVFGSIHGMLIAVPVVLAFQYLSRGRREGLGIGELIGAVTSLWWLMIDLLQLVENTTAETSSLALFLALMLIHPTIVWMILVQFHAGSVVLAIVASRLLWPRRRRPGSWSEHLGFCVGLAATAQAGVILLGLLDRQLIRLQ